MLDSLGLVSLVIDNWNFVGYDTNANPIEK